MEQNGAERGWVLEESFVKENKVVGLLVWAADRSSKLGHSKLVQGHWDIQNSKCLFGSRNTLLKNTLIYQYNQMSVKHETELFN